MISMDGAPQLQYCVRWFGPHSFIRTENGSIAEKSMGVCHHSDEESALDGSILMYEVFGALPGQQPLL